MINIKNSDITITSADIIGGVPHITYTPNYRVPLETQARLYDMETQALADAQSIVCVGLDFDTPEREYGATFHDDAMAALIGAMRLFERHDKKSCYTANLTINLRSVLQLMFMQGMTLDDPRVQRQAAAAAQALAEDIAAWQRRDRAQMYLEYVEDQTGMSFRREHDDTTQ